MKKAISILLAVATMAFATSAMAATDTANLTSGKSAGVQYNRNTYSFVTSSLSTTTMPCFRPGDTVKFDVTGATAGDDVTLITYKLGEGNNLSTSTVQYVNQYDDIAGTTKNVSYKVREGLDSGVYQLDIKVGENAIKTVYYKVGTVAATIIPANNNTYAYIIKENEDGSYTAGFVGKVKIDIADTTLADIGSKPGFDITIGGNTRRFNFGGTDGGDAIADLDVENTTAYASGDKLVTNFLTGVETALTGTGSEAELYGGYSFVYGMNVYNVDSEAYAEAIQATAVTDAE